MLVNLVLPERSVHRRGMCRLRGPGARVPGEFREALGIGGGIRRAQLREKLIEAFFQSFQMLPQVIGSYPCEKNPGPPMKWGTRSYKVSRANERVLRVRLWRRPSERPWGAGLGCGGKGLGPDRSRAQNLDLFLGQRSHLAFGHFGCGSRLLRSFRRLVGETLLETFHTTGGIHKLLASGKAWVTAGADVQPNNGLGRVRLERVSASARDCRFYIRRMNTFSHKPVI